MSKSKVEVRATLLSVAKRQGILYVEEILDNLGNYGLSGVSRSTISSAVLELTSEQKLEIRADLGFQVPSEPVTT